jgi:hypothetical protein
MPTLRYELPDAKNHGTALWKVANDKLKALATRTLLPVRTAGSSRFRQSDPNLTTTADTSVTNAKYSLARLADNRLNAF